MQIVMITNYWDEYFQLYQSNSSIQTILFVVRSRIIFLFFVERGNLDRKRKTSWNWKQSISSHINYIVTLFFCVKLNVWHICIREVCTNSFNIIILCCSYGLKAVNGVNRLSGDGLEAKDVPGMMQGGGKWPGRCVLNLQIWRKLVVTYF